MMILQVRCSIYTLLSNINFLAAVAVLAEPLRHEMSVTEVAWPFVADQSKGLPARQRRELLKHRVGIQLHQHLLLEVLNVIGVVMRPFPFHEKLVLWGQLFIL